MNKQKIFLICVIFIFLLLIGNNFYKDRNWDKINVCTKWYQYEEFNCTGEILNYCKDIKVEKNAWVQSCTCVYNNETGKLRVCPEKLEVWRYNEEW